MVYPDPDYDREMAIVAEAEVNGQRTIIRVVRIVGDNWHDSAELPSSSRMPGNLRGLVRPWRIISSDRQERGFSRLCLLPPSNTAMNSCGRARDSRSIGRYPRPNMRTDAQGRMQVFDLQQYNGFQYQRTLSVMEITMGHERRQAIFNHRRFDEN